MNKTIIKNVILMMCDIIDAAVDINGSPLPLECKILTYLIRNYELIFAYLCYRIEHLKNKKE